MGLRAYGTWRNEGCGEWSGLGASDGWTSQQADVWHSRSKSVMLHGKRLVDDADGSVTKFAGDVHGDVTLGGSQLLVAVRTGGENSQPRYRWAADLQVERVSTVAAGDAFATEFQADPQLACTPGAFDEIALDRGVHDGQNFAERHEVGVLDLSRDQFRVEQCPTCGTTD